MKSIVFICVVLMLNSCLDKTRMEAGENKPYPMKDSGQAGHPQIIQEVDKAGPIKAFSTFVSVLDFLGYSGDTARVNRLKNYSEFLGTEIVFFRRYPFYKMPREKSKILSWNNFARESQDSINTRIFDEAEDVWAYFYREREKSNLVVDGVIEQWRFADERAAKEAINALKSFYPLPFFNTEPYYATKGRFLFVFHTRASAFSYRQKEFFARFEEQTQRFGETEPRVND
jgi:hypothetical protein